MSAASPLTTNTSPARLGRVIDLDAILMLCQRDIVRYMRERAQLYGSLARAIVWLFIFGAGLRGSVNVPGGLSYTVFAFPGMLAMAVIFASLQSAVSVIFDREFGFLKEILVAPIPRSSVALGKALAGATIASLQGAVIFVFAPFIGLWPAPQTILACLVVMLLMGLGLTGVGIAIAARMTSFEGFGTVNNFVILPLYFTSGAQFPLSGAPEWLQVIVRLTPLAYGVDLLRGLLTGVWTNSAWLDLGVLVAFAAIAIGAASSAFGHTE
jgi:ABC-2 type transport system permease protein